MEINRMKPESWTPKRDHKLSIPLIPTSNDNWETPESISSGNVPAQSRVLG